MRDEGGERECDESAGSLVLEARLPFFVPEPFNGPGSRL